MIDRCEVTKVIPAEGGGSRQDRIVLAHLRFVHTVADRILCDLPVLADLNDLVQAGIVGLLDALENHSAPTSGVLSAEAKRRVEAAIFDSLQAGADSFCINAESESRARGSCKGPIRLRADRFEFGSGRQRGSGLGVRTGERRTEGLCTSGGLPEMSRADGTVRDIAAPPESRPDHICERNELQRTIAGAIDRLSPRYRRILLLSYDDELTTRQISRIVGVSETRVSQILRKALQKVRMDLRALGFGEDGHAVMAPERNPSGLSSCGQSSLSTWRRNRSAWSLAAAAGSRTAAGAVQ